MIDIKKSPTIMKYLDTMVNCMQMIYGEINPYDLSKILEYSIQKRLQDSEANISNSYKRYRDKDGKFQDVVQNTTLLKISDYILSREPIVTAFGTMFKHHGTVPNPMFDVIQSFLDLRSEHKKMMFSFPKGSESFEKYNLLQSLDKIDANGCYGCLGQYTSLIYNSNVATSVTSQGRALVSSMTLHFEQMLADNVKFGSLDQVIEFINHICSERDKRHFDDRVLLNHIPSKEECFAKIILECGYRWVPNEKEMDVIWKVINNLSTEDTTRVYYKNNLYEFASNEKVFNVIRTILKKLEKPLMNSLDIPDIVSEDLKLLCDMIMEYVYYRYMFIDRIDRCDNMIKSVTMVSDTDSTIISLDAWYRFVVNKVNGDTFKIANYTETDLIDHEDKPLVEKRLDYNFYTDEIEEVEHISHPEIDTPNDNIRFSIINILAYVLDKTVNDYMEKFCENNYSLQYDENGNKKRKCRIISKNEFTFRRLLMTQVKKNYASLIAVQEGNLVPEDAQLDVKGIEALTKSSKPLSTRKALQKILLEDILKAPSIDQLRIVKDIIIFEKQVVQSVKDGNREYYKPVVVKPYNAYSDPMRIQGVKASIAWNECKSESDIALNLDERNPVDIVKVVINNATVDKIKDTFPDVYENMKRALASDTFSSYVKDPKTGEKKVANREITAVALPLDIDLPDWLEPFIDYDEIINDNINGFPYESVGIQRLAKSNINYTNIVQL